MTQPPEREAVLLLADISGYTRFMLANRTALIHGQGIISDLLEAVIPEVEIPLEVHKFEGDAVFIAAENRGDGGWDEAGRKIRYTLSYLFGGKRKP